VLVVERRAAGRSRPRPRSPGSPRARPGRSCARAVRWSPPSSRAPITWRWSVT
jgi:hypothetical protein